MDLITDTSSCPELPNGSVVTIGAYDGLHLGHRAVIDIVRSRAAAMNAASAVVTFDRHPAAVVRPESAPRLLTDSAQKVELLATTGIDLTVMLHFDEQRAAETAERFVERRCSCNVFGHERSSWVWISISAINDGATWPYWPRWVSSTGSRSFRWSCWSGPTTSMSRFPPPLSGGPWPVARSTWPLDCLVGRSKCGGRWLRVTSEGDYWDFHCQRDGAREHVRARRWGICGLPEQPDGERFACAINFGRRPTFSTSMPTIPSSRPTCWSSPVTSMASRPR